MGPWKRPLVQLVWIATVFIFILGQCQGSRSTNLFKVKPNPPSHSGNFMGFFPRRIPIPASGPSRKHNDIGLQGRASSP
ncbi:hypothetical protein NMG60_11007106 [Bertholletia excelsa]